ncbi:RNase H1/viroplasmin domain-containing protein, partial [Candidatus Liberibacter asiaticus]|nr:RNase H1/viroplasmin domain-containing protein [Candidatus Liberibacter asiaticus]
MRKLIVIIQSLITTQKTKNKKINWVDEVEKEDSKNIYVVYNGPKPGIYTNWLEASRAIIGFSGIIHRCCTNWIEA